MFFGFVGLASDSTNTLSGLAFASAIAFVRASNISFRQSRVNASFVLIVGFIFK